MLFSRPGGRFQFERTPVGVVPSRSLGGAPFRYQLWIPAAEHGLVERLLRYDIRAARLRPAPSTALAPMRRGRRICGWPSVGAADQNDAPRRTARQSAIGLERDDVGAGEPHPALVCGRLRSWKSRACVRRTRSAFVKAQLLEPHQIDSANTCASTASAPKRSPNARAVPALSARCGSRSVPRVPRRRASCCAESFGSLRRLFLDQRPCADTHAPWSIAQDCDRAPRVPAGGRDAAHERARSLPSGTSPTPEPAALPERAHPMHVPPPPGATAGVTDHGRRRLARR